MQREEQLMIWVKTRAIMRITVNFFSTRWGCFIAAAVFTIAAAVEVHAESSTVRPTVIVPANVSVDGGPITLGKIAKISYKHAEFDALVHRLSDIPLGDAPPPKMKTSIPGAKILELIHAADIPLESFGYSIPKVVVVERKGRELTEEEVMGEVRTWLDADPRLDIQVKAVNWSHKQVVPMGKTRLKIERLGTVNGGKVPLRVTAFVDNVLTARFMATATVDDWREVPVLVRSLERGMLISPEDVELVRMNMLKQPRDIAQKIEFLIGRRAKQRLAAGSTVRKKAIDIPPIIPRGRSVTIVYNKGGVFATAIGTALQDGHDGGEIKVRNDNSRRIIKARVVNEGQVEVR